VPFLINTRCLAEWHWPRNSTNELRWLTVTPNDWRLTPKHFSHTYNLTKSTVRCTVRKCTKHVSFFSTIAKQIKSCKLTKCCIKPKFHYADFHRNFPVRKVVNTNHKSRGHKRWQITKSWSFGESHGHKSRKSRTQTILTCRDVCVKVRDKPVCVALMEFGPLHCTGKVGDKVHNKVRDKFPTKSRTCRGHKSRKSTTQITSPTFLICVSDKSATLSGTCHRLCRKVGIMEFGLYSINKFKAMQNWSKSDKNIIFLAA